ncbi:hypothetical protein [Variovorax sp. H27-G14]|uniref:hypothetical protein n=1 Tax=Variovorax sp. H27-G14 TaxID=3111914 RepID=UPI0038FCF20C
MSDDELDDFNINDESCRAKLFDAMKAKFNSCGPLSKQRVLESIEFILLSGEPDRYWRAVVPHEVLLDEVEDKVGYLRALYLKLAGHAPSEKYFDTNVELVTDLHGIDLRL